MYWKSRWTCDIPAVSLPSFVFKSPTAPLPTTPILLDADKPDKYSLSQVDYRLWSQRFAHGLRKAGLQDGDRVLLFSGNSLFFPVVFMGIIMAGGVFTGANPGYVARELAYQLKDSGAKFLITSEASLDTSLEAAKTNGFPTERIFAIDNGYATFDGKGKSSQGVRHWSQLISSPEDGSRFSWKELRTPEELDRTMCLNYSSGTTGVPKGVMITHKNYVANTAQVEFLGHLMPDYEERRKTARYLCFLPMYHAYGQTHFCVSAACKNIPVYIMQKFDFVKMLEHIQKYEITDLNLVPPIAVALAKHPASKQYDLSSVRTVGSGAAPLGREVSQEVEALFPNGTVNLKQGWGMTEVTCTATSWDPIELCTSHAVGELMPNVEARIVDEDGKDMPAGERGEFWVRGPNVMKGYWQKPDATKDTLTADGWLKTGDIALLDPKERIFIVDRKKELIKVKGNQVAPAELEALLLDHPAVADAAVIGVTIKGEELPRGYLVVRQDVTVSADDIHKFMATRVARHKRLLGGVVFVDAIPKNPSGKILRKQLRDQAKEEVGDSPPREARL